MVTLVFNDDDATYRNASSTQFYYDLTTKTGDSTEELGGALFLTQPAEGSSGTGLIQAFVRLQASGTEDGYNTSGRPIDGDYELNTSLSFTHNLKITDIPTLEINGTLYYEFRLDINQTNNSPLISLDQLKIYTSTTGSLTAEITDPAFTGATTPIYNLDTGTNKSVLLDYSLQAGSGKSDLFVYVPVASFGTTTNNTVVYLYSSFGEIGAIDASDGLVSLSGDTVSDIYGDYATNDGFEEWSVAKQIPGVEFSGYKWHDLDGDGAWDGGEGVLPGWQINYTVAYTITYKGNQTQNPPVSDSFTASAVTDANGLYTFKVPTFTDTNIQNIAYTLTIAETLQDPTVWTNTYGGYLDLNSDPVSPTVITFTDGDIDGKGSDIDTHADLGVAQALNFGNFQLYSISGTKFEDMDGDGAIENGDTGLGGFRIFIDANNSGTYNAGEKFAITAADGTWEITGLTGAYNGMKVLEEDKAGYVQTYGELGYGIVGTSGNDQDGMDFANFELFDLSGHKYEDMNGNGVVNAGDLGLEGWRVFIDNDNDGVVETSDGNGTWDAGEKFDFTDATGYWEITGLDKSYNGYKVLEQNQAGWVQTLGTAGYPIVATSGNDQTFDFANFELFDLSGHKYEDMNGNGVVNVGDLGLEGWRVFIDNDNDGVVETSDGNGTWDAGEKFDFTDATGYWEITGLDKSYNGYKVLEQNQAGWVQTLGTAGYPIVATSGNDQTFDFANFELFDLSGHKYEDMNGNGVVNAGDLGLEGWRVFIDNDNDGVVETSDGNGTWDAGEKFDFTDATGYWEITGLDKSYNGYKVLEQNQAGWVQTLGTAGYPIVATSGNDQTFNFANFEKFDISGYKWEDSDGDSGWDQGETGKEGWTIYIEGDLDGDGLYDDYADDTTTDADGFYSFTDLGPGKYRIFEDETVDGWTKTFGVTAIVIGVSGVSVSGTEGKAEDLNFGNFEEMNLSGFKWGDSDGNSDWNGAEGGLTGWQIVIDTDQDSSNGYLLADTTDANGYYSFDGLTLNTLVTGGTLGDHIGQTLYLYEVTKDGFTQTYNGGYSFTITSGLTIEGESGDAVQGNFGNHMMAGANRTPGFWQSTLGKSLYDGNDNNNGDANGPKDGDQGRSDEALSKEGWTTTDLLSKYGIDTADAGTKPDTFIVWGDSDAIKEPGEILLTSAQLAFWVGGGSKGGNDFLSILERDVAAVFLNTLNNASLGTPDEETGDVRTGITALDPSLTDSTDSYYDAIAFILKYDPDLDGTASGSKKDQQADWNSFGSAAHIELAAYNESGEANQGFTTTLVQVAMDGDDYSSALVQNYLAVQGGVIV
ncbi:hypothetical protein H7F51_07080 [Novosphingobium flavum]|uniref:SD-repeat containing protein B domain-containing protein n=1 Tax=Novosphingobium flavum TaxID=1778672 RepID=A0A7X1KL78_9SPHN|nr:hypothetical protein [Novosphingobium flavum]MBC2665277.1 hypothetical protein [Novosphingobium flavum]